MSVTDVYADWTTTAASNTPAGSAVPEIDDELRNVKAQVKANCVILSGNQTITGVKTFSSLPEVGTTAPSSNGQVAMKKYVDDQITTRASTAIQGLISSGTKMIFYQPTAPTGWTQVTSVNDKVLRVVDTTGTGGASGGSWTISGITVDTTILTTAQIPAHTHVCTYSGLTSSATSTGITAGGGDIYWSTALTSTSTTNAGGGGGHLHTLTIGAAWRPAYIDIIIASRNT